MVKDKIVKIDILMILVDKIVEMYWFLGLESLKKVIKDVNL